MSKLDEPGIESLGYTKAQADIIRKASEASVTVTISGFTTSVKRANCRKLVEDVAADDRPLKDCGKDD